MQKKPHAAAMIAHSGIGLERVSIWNIAASGGAVNADTPYATDSPPDTSSPERVSINSPSMK